MKPLILLSLTALLLAACGSGANDVPKGPISENRTAAFKAFMQTFPKMGKAVKGDEPYKVEEFKAWAAQFAQDARKPFEFFQNDAQGNGDALPEIWQKSADFKVAQDRFLAAVDELNAAAQTGKLDDIKAAYETAAASCKSCHDSFRRPK